MHIIMDHTNDMNISLRNYSRHGASNQKIGQEGETIAAHFLQSLDFVILDHNYRYGRYEIDLIGQKNNTTVFVEVKARTSHEFGTGIEAISPQKMRCFMKAVMHYLKEHPTRQWRFDVVSICLREDHSVSNIEHFKNIIPF